jgi:hypothetical protein
MPKKKFNLLKGLDDTAKSVTLTAKSVYYKETPQVKGRIGRAFASDTKGGKGRISKRGSFVDDMLGVKQRTRQSRGRIVRSLARNTKGGKGRISKRPAYRQHLPKR